jgi:uncharacterized protein YbjT (DUF2867 family)
MQARRKFAVAGVTGTIGRHVVDVLEAEGHDVVGMSRSLGVDVVTGEVLAEAPGRRGVHNRRRHPALARPAGGHRVIHRRGPDPAGGRRAADGRGMAKLLVARRGDPVRIEGVSGFYGPADPDRELYESGALLPGPEATLAGPTFAEWLDSTSRVVITDKGGNR